MAEKKVRPTDIKLHQKSRALEIAFDDGSRFRLPVELLRVYSPSAEVRGHGPGQEVLQIGKENVNITDLRQVGNYAIQPTFDDGHDTGIFDWNLLYRMGLNQDRLWDDYLERLRQAGYERKEPR